MNPTLHVPDSVPAVSGSLRRKRRALLVGHRGTIETAMDPVDRQFVERRDEGFYLAGSRVPLASIVREFRDGQSPEAIRLAFPTLTLEQVYSAITFYLGHKDEVDSEITARERIEDAFTEAHRPSVETDAR